MTLQRKNFYKLNTGEYHYGNNEFESVNIVVCNCDNQKEADKKLNEFFKALETKTKRGKTRK